MFKTLFAWPFFLSFFLFCFFCDCIASQTNFFLNTQSLLFPDFVPKESSLSVYFDNPTWSRGSVWSHQSELRVFPKCIKNTLRIS